MIEMKVQGVTLDPITNMPVVILKSVDTNHVLPLWIGVFEANAILSELENVKRPRPMTHDLLKNVFDIFNSKVEFVYISDLIDSTYYAKIVVKFQGNKIQIDSRPSDAINLALRCDVPIYVSKEVLEKLDDNLEVEMEKEELEEWLESLKPEDFE